MILFATYEIGKVLIRPDKVLIICQGNLNKKFLTQMKNLFLTLQLNGGVISKAKRIACLSEVGPNFVEPEFFNKLNVKVQKIDDIDARHIISNKIQMLNQTYLENDFELVVALDTDIVITKDFSSFLNDDKIGGAPVRRPKNRMENWKDFYKFFGIKLPEQRFFSTITYDEMPPYFNSGVLVVPRKHVTNLYNAWKKFVLQLIDCYSEIPNNLEPFRRVDQLGLALALTDECLPFYELPLEMNFPTPRVIHPKFNPENLEPSLLHYHANFNGDGTLGLTSYSHINEIIEKINRQIKI